MCKWEALCECINEMERNKEIRELNYTLSMMINDLHTNVNEAMSPSGNEMQKCEASARLTIVGWDNKRVNWVFASRLSASPESYFAFIFIKCRSLATQKSRARAEWIPENCKCLRRFMNHLSFERAHVGDDNNGDDEENKKKSRVAESSTHLWIMQMRMVFKEIIIV